MGMGYPNGILQSRSIIKKNNYALIAPTGLVKSTIYGFENCEISILASPKLGAKFVDYIITMKEGGKNAEGFGGDGVETFLYVISGKVKAGTDGEKNELTDGGFLYCPPDEKMYFENMQKEDARVFLYKQRYIEVPGKPEMKPWVVTGNEKDIEFFDYEDMANVHMKNFLPTDIVFDMNFHILSFDPGGSHPMIETHYPEHGAYILSGEGVYNLDNDWVPVQKDDYLYMSAYSLQAAYGAGRGPFAYVYSKDCNRDPEV